MIEKITPTKTRHTIICIALALCGTLYAQEKPELPMFETYLQGYSDKEKKIEEMNQEIETLDVSTLNQEELEKLAILIVEYKDLEIGALEILQKNLEDAKKSLEMVRESYGDFHDGSWNPLANKYLELIDAYQKLSGNDKTTMSDEEKKDNNPTLAGKSEEDEIPDQENQGTGGGIFMEFMRRVFGLGDFVE